jgi:hypothetical protein
VTHRASASIRYSEDSPTTGISAPASSGPTTRPVCITVAPSAFAAGSSSAGTSRAMEALRAGELSPKNACCAANSSIRTSTECVPVTACAQKSSDVTAMPLLVTSISLRRSTMSATAPPHSANTTMGTRPARLA